jgi:endonuclease/exonuclease/phosphatase family metal-dependent hydrolase
LFAQALGTLAIGSGAFGSNGVIQLLADDLNVSVSAATYAVTAGRSETRIVSRGPLKLAHVAVAWGARELQVVGLNTSAVVDRGGYKLWKVQLRRLVAHVPMLQTPAVLAGDFNTTRFRPEFRSLLRAGLTRRSWHRPQHELQTRRHRFVRGPGTVVRLDHALLTKGVYAIDAENLDACDSDHLPFRVTLAVRQPHRVTTTVTITTRKGYP